MSTLFDLLNTGELPEKLSTFRNSLQGITQSDKNVQHILNEFYPGLEFEMARAYMPMYDKVIISGKNGRDYKRLFVKEAGEGILREILALELNNLLTGREIPYVLYGSVIATAEIKGRQLNSSVRKDTENYAYHYGMLNEFSRVIGLDDRKEANIVVRDDNSLWNIDLGQAFLHDSTKILEELQERPPYPIPYWKWVPAIERGADDARAIIKKNIENNMDKLKNIMESIDEEAYEKLKWGYVLGGEIINPKEILLKYVCGNGWRDIASQLR